MSAHSDNTEVDAGTPSAPGPGDRVETTTGPTSRSTTAMTAAGAVLVLLGLFMTWGGIAPLSESSDADGYYMSDFVTVDRPSRAVVTTDMDLLRGRWETLAEESFVEMFMSKPDAIRVQGLNAAPNAIFLGIGPSSDVEQYLDGVARDEISDWGADQARIHDIEYTTRQGTISPNPPGDETFWLAWVSGTGSQTLDWTIPPGDWTAVVMNADASSGVTAELAFGALPPSRWITLHWGSFAVGLVLVAAGGLLVYPALRR